MTFGLNGKADFVAAGFKTKGAGQSFYVRNIGELKKVRLQIPGKFNALNALGAMAAAKSLGFLLEESKEALESMNPVPGRFNMVDLEEHGKAIVDYAHTPDGLENVLKAAREIVDELGGRLISIFGCGGNRDVKKRSIMGKISEKYADLSIVTSDNPRFEPPEKIIEEILAGMEMPTHFAVVDRSAAIRRAIEMSGQNDIILISGKGAEDYLDIGGKKLPYTDYETITEAIESIKQSEN